MATNITSILSTEDISLILGLNSEVLDKASSELPVIPGSKSRCALEIPESILSKLSEAFGFEVKSPVYSQFVRGDTHSHVDSAAVNPDFVNTHLLYLVAAGGYLVVEGDKHPIVPGNGYVFPRGCTHSTIETADDIRLSLGPFNEHLEAVGANVTYYGYRSPTGSPTDTLLGVYPAFGSYTILGYAAAGGVTPPGLNFVNWYDNVSTTYFNAGTIITYAGEIYNFQAQFVSTLCFKEDSKILALDPVYKDEKYIEIQDLCVGDLVKTVNDGFLPIHSIGSTTIHNEATVDRSPQNLYECKKANFSELLSNSLVVTGYHSFLVDKLTQKQQEDCLQLQGKLYKTGEKYRLPACVYEKCSVYEKPGQYKVWHLSLQNENDRMNYGIYAEGVLVETCSIRALTKISGLQLK